MFPIPTHIVRRQRVFQVSLTGGDAGKTIYGMWMPECIDTAGSGGTSAVQTGVFEGFKSGFVAATQSSTQGYSNNSVEGQSVATSYAVYTPPLTATASIPVSTLTMSQTNVAHGGVRLIGAFIEFEYVGTTEQHSGMIEVGLHLHSANNLMDLAVPHLMDQTEIVQAPFYRKFRPIDGCRCVWFPVDNADFEFQNYATDPDNNRLNDDTGALILSTTGAANSGGTATSFAGYTYDKYSNAFGSVGKRNYAQWAINISGLQTGQSVRVQMSSFYETIPDENYRDIFMPKKSLEYSDPSSSKSALTALAQQGAFATPAKTSGGFANVMSAINQAADIAMKTYGVISPVISGYAAGGVGGGILGLGSQVLNWGKSAI